MKKQKKVIRSILYKHYFCGTSLLTILKKKGFVIVDLVFIKCYGCYENMTLYQIAQRTTYLNTFRNKQYYQYFDTNEKSKIKKGFITKKRKLVKHRLTNRSSCGTL